MQGAYSSKRGLDPMSRKDIENGLRQRERNNQRIASANTQASKLWEELTTKHGLYGLSALFKVLKDQVPVDGVSVSMESYSQLLSLAELNTKLKPLSQEHQFKERLIILKACACSPEQLVDMLVHPHGYVKKIAMEKLAGNFK
jgi:hypothetical protein